MKYGDKDGYNEIYDDNGNLILHPDEKILVSEENVVPSLKSTWRYYGGDYLLEPSKGTMILTNERLVFINIPERMFAIGGTEESRAMSAPVGSTFELGDMTPGAAVREFFEIPNIEIMGSEQKEGAVSVGEMVNVYILSSGNQFHLSTVLTEDSNLLLRLMNKKVETLDELVNNLKDFFRKTDWMFVEGEKKVYGALMKKQEDAANIEKSEIPGPEPTSSPVSKMTSKAPANAPTPSFPKRRIPITSGVEAKSREYFESLYSKGLIKEEIYKKLMVQYSSTYPIQTAQPVAPVKPIQNRTVVSSSPSNAGEVAQPPQVKSVEEAQPAPVPEAPPGDDEADDDELLSMLNTTLSDMDDTPAPEPEKAETEAVPKQRVVRAKKVHRKKK